MKDPWTEPRGGGIEGGSRGWPGPGAGGRSGGRKMETTVLEQQ